MVKRALTLAAGGVTVDMAADLDLMAGVAGFGLAPVEPQWLTGAGDGSIYRGARTLSRTMAVPVFISGDTDYDIQDTLDDLAFALAPENAPARLTMTFDPDESGAESWWVDVVRTGGGDWEWGESAGRLWVMTMLELTAGDPMWTSTEAETATYTTFGNKTIVNPGTAAAWPVWEVHGAATGFSLTLGTAVLEYEDAIATDAELTVDTDAGTIVDSSGANKYAGLAAAPRFFSLPPGSSTVGVAVTGGDGNTAVTLTYYPRRSLIY